MTSVWSEVADRVWVRRYEALDQTIGAIGGEAGLAVIDTRANHRLADELRDDLRQLPGDLVAVVNTHGHWDHAFGNARFAPLPIWATSAAPTSWPRPARPPEPGSSRSTRTRPTTSAMSS